MSENVSSLTWSWKTVTSWDVFWKEAKLRTLLLFTSKSKLVNWIARVNFVTVKYLVCLTLVFHQVLDSGKMGVLSASKRALFSFSSIILNWSPPPCLPPCYTTVSHCHGVLPYHSHTSHISNLLHLKRTKVSTLFRWWPCGQICDPGNFLVVWLCFLMSQSLFLNSWNLWSFVEIRQF